MSDDGIDGQHLPFNEGLPTRPDVDLLMRTFPNLQVADRIEYEAIEKLIGCERRSARFKTVCTVWRRRMMNDHSVVIEAIAGESFYVASADQISSATYGTLTFISRKAKKQRRKLAVAKIETDQQRLTVEHQARLLLHVERDVKKQRMNILPDSSIAEAPKIEPPKSSPKPKKDGTK